MGPSGVSIHAMRMHSAERAAPGGVPTALANASRKPECDSQSWSSAASSRLAPAFDGGERLAQPPSAGVGLEGHAVGPLEPAPHGGRVETLAAQIGVGDAAAGLGFHALDQGARPVRRAAVAVERVAAGARPEAGKQRLARRGVEGHVLRPRPRAGQDGRQKTPVVVTAK